MDLSLLGALTLTVALTAPSVRAALTDEMVEPYVTRLAEARKASHYYDLVKQGLDTSFMPVKRMRVVDLMGHQVIAALGQAGKSSLIWDLQSLLGSIDLPSDLTFEELNLYVNNSRHPVFAPLTEVAPRLSISWTQLRNNHRLYTVLDAVRQLRVPGSLSKRKRAPELRAAIETFLGHSIDGYQITEDGHLTGLLPKTARIDVALSDIIDELSRAGVLGTDGMISVASHLRKVSMPIFGRDFGKIPAHEFMSSAFLGRVANWSQKLEGNFRLLMARADLPVNLSPQELAAFRRDPSQPIFSRLDRIGLEASKASLVKLTSEARVAFVIDVVKKHLDLEAADISTKNTCLSLYDATLAHLAVSYPDALNSVNAWQSPDVSTPSKECKDALLGDFETKDLVLELYKKFFPNGSP